MLCRFKGISLVKFSQKLTPKNMVLIGCTNWNLEINFERLVSDTHNYVIVKSGELWWSYKKNGFATCVVYLLFEFSVLKLYFCLFFYQNICSQGLSHYSQIFSRKVSSKTIVNKHCIATYHITGYLLYVLAKKLMAICGFYLCVALYMG